MNDADADNDGDGISNIDEFNADPRTKAGEADTDDDTLPDNVETNTGVYVSPTDTGTNPVKMDTDGDGLADNVETGTGVFASATDQGTNPVVTDTDGDGFEDGREVALGFNPLDATSQPSVPILGFDLLGNDLTDPEDDGDPEANTGYAAVFDASEEAGFGGGESAFNVFDNAVGGGNNKWCCGSAAFPGKPLWVQATFEEAIVLSHFTITSAEDAPERDPRVWEIQGSNDGENFTTIFRQDDPGDPIWDARNQVAEFRAGTHFQQPAAYMTIRFSCIETGVSSGALFQIAELEFFGAPGLTDAFEIDEVRRMTVDGKEVLQITFPSTPGASFRVETGVNMQDWSQVTNGLAAAEGDTTTYQLELADPVADVHFVRVRQE